MAVYGTNQRGWGRFQKRVVFFKLKKLHVLRKHNKIAKSCLEHNSSIVEVSSCFN
jgi:hypothetical protein